LVKQKERAAKVFRGAFFLKTTALQRKNPEKI